MSLLTASLKRLQAKKGIKFKSGYLNQGAKKLMTPDVFTIMKNEQNTWKIDNKSFDQKWQQIFQFLVECEVQIFILSDNNNQNILKQIKEPNYLKLRVLALNKNGLTSVEMLCQFNFPTLQSLDLSVNNITIIHSLCHLAVPLKTLKLYGNPIIDVQKLERAGFVGLNQLRLQESSKDVVIGDDLRWLLKIPSPQFTTLYCASRKRFRQEVIWKELGKKYKGGRIFLK